MHNPVMELYRKKTIRPSRFQNCMCAVNGGVINATFVIRAASGIVWHLRSHLMECNGGHIMLPVKKTGQTIYRER